MGRSTRAGDHGQVGPGGPLAPAGPAGPDGFPQLGGSSFAQPLLTLCGVGGVAAGLSGLVAEVMGRGAVVAAVAALWSAALAWHRAGPVPGR